MKCLHCRKTVEIIEARDFCGLHKVCFLKNFKLTDSLKFSNLDPKKPDSSSGYSHIKKTKDSFYHGRYRKYSAYLGATRYILKIQEEKFPDLPAIEYVCNKIASLLNLSVPEYHLIKYKVEDETKHNIQEQIKNESLYNKSNIGSMTFIVRNFMQDYKGGTLHHIYKFLPKGAKNHNCKNIIDVLFHHTKPADVARFIEITLFDSLIGNNDRHGRNLGIIESTKQKRLAPMYDNPSYFGIESDDLIGADFNISGCIRTSLSKEPMLMDYLKEFQSLGFEKICLEFFKKVTGKFSQIIESIESSEVSEKRRKAFTKFLHKQL
ncbi:MAG: HipA domain-containing protein, partial [Bdellovibrionales bacterium]|nr:HipA domain-containing protein [Bdellovibrionales bacterium]